MSVLAIMMCSVLLCVSWCTCSVVVGWANSTDYKEHQTCNTRSCGPEITCENGREVADQSGRCEAGDACAVLLTVDSWHWLAVCREVYRTGAAVVSPMIEHDNIEHDRVT